MNDQHPWRTLMFWLGGFVLIAVLAGAAFLAFSVPGQAVAQAVADRIQPARVVQLEQTASDASARATDAETDLVACQSQASAAQQGWDRALEEAKTALVRAEKAEVELETCKKSAVDPTKLESGVTEGAEDTSVGNPDLGARTCDSDIASNMDNPNKPPTTVVEPGNGLVMSADPITVTGNGKVILASKDKGVILGFINDGTEPITVIMQTSWNTPNEQWNVYVCRFVASAVADQASIKQGEDKKPVFGVIAWSDVKDIEPAETTETPTKAPEAKEVGSTRLSGHFPVGNHVNVLDGEKFWMSSDPGEVCVGTVCSTQTSGYTLLLSGPVDVLVKSPNAEVTNYVVGNAPDFNWNGTDGKSANLTFRDGEFVNR